MAIPQMTFMDPPKDVDITITNFSIFNAAMPPMMAAIAMMTGFMSTSDIIVSKNASPNPTSAPKTKTPR